MLNCKSSAANIENCSILFFLLGLVMVLIGVYYSIELEISIKPDLNSQNVATENTNDELEIPPTFVEPEPVKSIEPVIPIPILDKIKIVSDKKNIVESLLQSTETTIEEKVVVQKIEIQQIKETKVDEEVVEDVPFFIIEEVPKYPGCTGTNEELRKCMEENIRTFVYENFNTELSQELGLPTGVQRIFIAFVIDKNGNIAQIESRAPHKLLQAEAQRVIQKLPKMEPGKQRGKPVGVKYNLPIVFEVLSQDE